MREKFLAFLRETGGRRPRLRNAMARLHNALGGNSHRIRGRHTIREAGAYLRGVVFDMAGDGHVVEIRPGARVENVTVLARGSGHRLIIGSECFIKSASIAFEDSDCRIEIGPETTIEHAHVAATEPGSSISVGRDCMLAYDVEIRTGDSHSIIDRASGRRLNPAQSVRIGDHVWLAPHVRVLKGVSIGDGSVIGTGSVVTAPIADHVVACGIPAAVVRENIDWDRRRLQGETAEAASGRGP